MSESNDSRYLRNAWLLIGAFALGRLLYAHGFLLVPDETNYWQWARHLDWGYYDQAPLLAWAIYLTTHLLGNTEVAVRLPSLLALTVASVYLLLLARRWFGARLAWYTTLLSQSVFLFNVGALLATTDGLQAAAWAAASYHTARAFEEDHWQQWLLAGVWFGFGMLSKYTMVLFLPCILLFACMSPVYRRRLFGWMPYAGFLVGMGMFAPVIYWNAIHHWSSVRHVAYIGGANQGFALHLKFLGDYLGSQAALLTPLVFVLILSSWWWALRTRYPADDWKFRYLFCTSFPVVAGFAILSLHTRVYGNWPGAGYTTVMLLVAARWATRPALAGSAYSGKAPPRKVWWWTIGSAYLITGIILCQVLFFVLPIPAKLDRAAKETLGWDRLGERVAAMQAAMPRPAETFPFGLSYQVASELAFYIPGQPFTVAINRWNRPNVYDDWWQDKDLIGEDGIGVLYNKTSTKRLLQVFTTVDPPVPFVVYRKGAFDFQKGPGDPVTTFYIYRCYGFKGGLRWIPPDRSDVRAVTR